MAQIKVDSINWETAKANILLALEVTATDASYESDCISQFDLLEYDCIYLV
ncbi:hypothetical protein P872_21885 [Rhodonellum psychrophilum GCM71 = DSM 17998]|uniref:Uncharacterized protein n=1 Tax=Rhodonellum psychrophilum GCM71 = DSM 17998 TaxID=1123057 RepID=U5BRB8_9BACT|nr:hypothetical protein P872_21885 [Rhodonellum psychrophilum GCM71 = DSM 17998]